MKLVAEVKCIILRGIHKSCTGYLPTGEAILEDLPDPIRPEIEIGDDGTCMIYRYGIGNIFCGDTRHETLEDAKMNGAFEYGLSESDWREEPAD